jgi:hypothetical protein
VKAVVLDYVNTLNTLSLHAYGVEQVLALSSPKKVRLSFTGDLVKAVRRDIRATQQYYATVNSLVKVLPKRDSPEWNESIAARRELLILIDEYAREQGKVTYEGRQLSASCSRIPSGIRKVCQTF